MHNPYFQALVLMPIAGFFGLMVCGQGILWFSVLFLPVLAVLGFLVAFVAMLAKSEMAKKICLGSLGLVVLWGLRLLLEWFDLAFSWGLLPRGPL